MNIKVDKIYFLIFLFSIHLIPFASYFSFETAPLLLIIFCLLNLIFSKKNFSDYFIDDKLILLFFISIFLIFLSDVFLLQNSFLELFKILIGPLIFISYPKIKKYFGADELLIFGIFIIFLFIIFKLKIPYLFDYSCGSLEFFIKRLSCDNTVNLSTPFLIASEPSYLSLMLSFYLILLIFFTKNVSKSKKIVIKTVEIFILFIIYETNSRIGTLFIIFYLAYYLMISSKIRFISFIFFIVVSLSFITQFHSYKLMGMTKPIDDYINSEGKVQNDEKYLVSSRRILNFNEFIKIDKTDINYQGSFLDIFSKVEPTGFIRILHNYLSILAFIDEPLGNGIGTYPVIWHKHVNKNNLDDTIKKNEVIRTWYDQGIENKKQYIQNYFFTLLHDGGIIPSTIFIIILLISIYKVVLTKLPIYYLLSSYLIICFFFQSNITSPYPWIIMAMIYFKKTQINLHNKKKQLYV